MSRAPKSGCEEVELPMLASCEVVGVRQYKHCQQTATHDLLRQACYKQRAAVLLVPATQPRFLPGTHRMLVLRGMTAAIPGKEVLHRVSDDCQGFTEESKTPSSQRLDYVAQHTVQCWGFGAGCVLII